MPRIVVGKRKMMAAVVTAVVVTAVLATVVASAAADALGRSNEETDRAPIARVARVHVVEMRGFEFVPARIPVAVGDTILWINHDPVPHTATARDSTWDSGRIEAGESVRMVVRREFKGEYFCVYHPVMTGSFQLDPAPDDGG
jgi:plastocyanin